MHTPHHLASALAVVGVAVGALAAQDVAPRTPQQLDTTTTGIGLNPSVGNDGQLSAVSWFDSGSDTVSVSFSDGRGVEWSAPIRVDDDTSDPPANKLSQFDSCLVLGDNTYVVWKDERLGSSSDRIAFTRSVNGGAFEANTLLDEGYGGTGKVFAWRFAGSRGPLGDGTDDYLFVVQNSDGPVSDDECFLVWSDDSGATWQGPLKVGGDALGGFDVDGVAVAADGSVAHIMWDDDTLNGSGLDSPYYRRFDATTGLLGPTIQLDSTDVTDIGDSAPTGTYNFVIDADGDLVVAAWPEERFDPTDEEVRVAVSTDGGASFLPDEYVGDYSTPLDDDVDFLTAGISDGNVVVAYSDNREDLAGGGIGTGSGALDQVYVSVAVDPLSNPLLFNEVAKVSAPEGGSGVRIATDGGPDVGLTWTSDLSGGQYAGAAFSQDGGQTWTGAIRVSKDDPSLDADIAEIGYNAVYGNFIHCWLSNDIGINNVFAGGYRPATLEADGFVAGNTVVNFDFANLITNGDNVNAAVVLSASPASGDFTLAGLDTGLAFDPVTSLGLSFVTFLSAPVAPDGSASTPALPVNLPPGITLYATGIGFKTGPGTIDRITDVVEIAF